MSRKDHSRVIHSIEPLIRVIRGKRVILDADLAGIYGVSTKRLNEQVRRNKDKFPEDFMFRLTMEEAIECSRSQNVTLKDANLRSQFATSRQEERSFNSRSQNATLKQGHNIKYLPYAFTEHGAIMAANILNSREAVQTSVFVVRAFVKMREVLSGHKELAEQLVALEKKLTDRLDIHEVAIVDILQRIMSIIDPPPPPPAPPKAKIGF